MHASVKDVQIACRHIRVNTNRIALFFGQNRPNGHTVFFVALEHSDDLSDVTSDRAQIVRGDVIDGFFTFYGCDDLTGGSVIAPSAAIITVAYSVINDVIRTEDVVEGIAIIHFETLEVIIRILKVKTQASVLIDDKPRGENRLGEILQRNHVGRVLAAFNDIPFIKQNRFVIRKIDHVKIDFLVKIVTIRIIDK